MAARVRRDLEAGRYDHVPQGAPWLRELAVEAARVAQVPRAAINLVKSSLQRTVASVGLEPGLHARADSMCGAIVDEGRRVHVSDASRDERWAGNPFVHGHWGRVRFYGAHPLLTPTGFPVGTLCVLDDRPRELDAAQIEALDALAERVVTELEARRLAALKPSARAWDDELTWGLGR